MITLDEQKFKELETQLWHRHASTQNGRGDGIYAPQYMNAGQFQTALREAILDTLRSVKQAEPVAAPNRAEFEEQAKRQAPISLEPALFGCCRNGWNPATYADPMVEFAWRMWANKPQSAPAPDKQAEPVAGALIQETDRSETPGRTLAKINGCWFDLPNDAVAVLGLAAAPAAPQSPGR